jgi:hypothetical protein
MAKKYHKSTPSVDMHHDPRDNRDMAEHKRMMSTKTDDFKDSRARAMYNDGSMIHEDHSRTSNLPGEVMMKPYPRNPEQMTGYIDDTIRGIDELGYFDHQQMGRHLKPKKL